MVVMGVDLGYPRASKKDMISLKNTSFLHSRIQINVREFRGQGAHCKDLSLIPYLDVFNGVGVEWDGGSCPLFQSFVFFAFLFSSMFFLSLSFFSLTVRTKTYYRIKSAKGGSSNF